MTLKTTNLNMITRVLFSRLIVKSMDSSLLEILMLSSTSMEMTRALSTSGKDLQHLQIRREQVLYMPQGLIMRNLGAKLYRFIIHDF